MAGSSSGIAALTLAAADDLAQTLPRWRDWLAIERRFSPHTVTAYEGDVLAFLTFLAGHRGQPVRLTDLADAKLADFRAWLTKRATGGAAATSRARAISAVKNLFRWLDRGGILHNAAIEILTTPKLPRSVPKPLAVTEAAALLDAAETFVDEPWIGLRDRALFTLLYGGGLRIAEALALNRNILPLGDALTVLGKGRKQRVVPILPAVAQAIAAYAAACPYRGGKDAPLFVGAKGKHGWTPPSHSAPCAACGGNSNSRTPRLRTRCGTVSPPILLANGGDLRAIQELLGHASLSTTQRYTEIETEQMLATYQGAHPRARS